MSDMGDMQEERPEMLEIPESEWEWLCFGLGDTLPSPHVDSTAKMRNIQHVSYILILKFAITLIFHVRERVREKSMDRETTKHHEPGCCSFQ
jgi:hypothetical protein